MNIPNLLSARDMRQLALPTDTKAVRVMLQKVHSSGQARLRGWKRQYLLERNAEVGCHVLDIPESVWMHGIPSGRYLTNFSVAHDIQCKHDALSPFILTIVPWSAPVEAGDTPAAPAVDTSDIVESVRGLFIKLDAPPIAFTAIDVLRDEGLEAFREFIGSIKDPEPDEDDEDEPDHPAEPSESQTETAKVIGDAPVTPAPAPASVIEINPATGKPYTTAALRMRNKRARDKAASEAANLQPA